MKNLDANVNQHSIREAKSSLRVAIWSVAWGGAVALGSAAAAAAAAVQLPAPKLFVGIAALMIYSGISLGTIRAYIRWLKVLDEMQRKIQLETMAMTLGALWMVLGGLLILNAAEIISIDRWEVSLLVVLAGLGMAVGSMRMLKS